jgi:hypothetical protein
VPLSTEMGIAIALIHKFLGKMFPGRWPAGFTEREQQLLIADTTFDEIGQYAIGMLPDRDLRHRAQPKPEPDPEFPLP